MDFHGTFDNAEVASDSMVGTEKQQDLNRTKARRTLQDVLPAHPQPWYMSRHLLLLNSLMIIPYLSSTNNGYDGSMLNGLQSMTQWQTFFNHPTGASLGALANGYIFGEILAWPFISWVCDSMGRRFPIFLGSVLLVIGAILQAAAQNYAMFLIARMVIGFGGLMALVPSPLWVSETAYPTHRHVLTALFNTIWYLGAAFAAWITFGTYHMSPTSSWSWRIPSLLQGFFPLIQLVFVYFIPESPRYLIYKGRLDEARRVIVKYHAGGDDNAPIVDFEMEEISAALEAEKLQGTSSYLDFFKTKGNRQRLFLVCFVPIMMQLSGNGLASYYLAKVLISIGITSANEQLIINGVLMVYNLVLAIAQAFTVEKVGRRGLFLFSTCGMLVSFTIWTALSAINQETNFQQASLGNGVLAMIFLYYFCYDAGLNGAPYLFLTEVLTYQLRAKGINLMQIVKIIALIYNGFVNPIAMDAIQWRYYIVFVCIIAVEVVVVYFFFPETKGRTLEEVAVIFDGDAAFVDYNGAPVIEKGAD
ncbi:hypothetical protein BZG36_03256 [Bifiguratus adelaidae]|uniref:Major facilitator superfamily (MFS) profile domain-containing protein n=1 Tax=Bifiguratus adelaidae TaxID=1938954 RepID=A0A261Y052_9FUNG|nr:hypothetical protein BZG36_03256 [Bifiguratus adelaidae]